MATLDFECALVTYLDEIEITLHYSNPAIPIRN
jgi:hypothetical protein